MKTNTMTIVRSAAVVAALLAMAPVSAQAQDVLKSKVVSAQQAAQVNLGSKKALGYFSKRNGKCDITVMVVEAENSKSTNDSSAARVRVAIAPGATASIDSAQGRTVELFCGSGARRLVVMTLGDKFAPQS